MTKSEKKARQWLIKEKGLKPGEIRKRGGSPDFETPIGNFEVKMLYGDCIIFYAVQIEQLRALLDTTVLVFNLGDDPIAQIPFSDIDFASKSWGNLRVVCQPNRTIRLTDGAYIALDAIREKRETFSEAVERLIKVYATLKDVSDTLGPSHWLKERPSGQTEGAKPLH